MTRSRPWTSPGGSRARSIAPRWSRCRPRRPSGPPLLRRAHAEAPAAGATDDAMLVEALGGTVLVVPGEPGNLKITDPDDLAGGRAAAGRRGRDVSVRIGQGIDVHRFSEDPHRPLVLGGVVIEGARGLGGHSDADAVCHALADAVLGAVGLGDLGRHFPDTDPVWEGADSVALLTEVLAHGGRARATPAPTPTAPSSPTPPVWLRTPRPWWSA